MKGEARKKLLLEAGVKLAKKHDVNKLTRRAVAEQAGCSEALVNTYLGGLADMRSAIKKHAKKTGVELGGPVKSARVVVRADGSKVVNLKAKKGRCLRELTQPKSAARAPKQPPVTA